MIFLKENENTIIYRVWIIKKSISYFDIKVGGLFISPPDIRTIRALLALKSVVDFCVKFVFKHWAIILELSNGSYVNIQFGRNGFSLKEFNKANNSGKNIDFLFKIEL